MKKVLVLSLCGAVAVGAVYLGGVYYTGKTFDNYLDNIDSSVGRQLCSLGSLDGCHINYKRENSSLFKENGSIIFKTTGKEYSIPAQTNIGFLSTDTVLDTSKLTDLIGQSSELDLIPSSVETGAYIHSSLLSDVEGNLEIKGTYEESSKGKLDSLLKINVDKNENINSILNIKNLHVENALAVENIEISSNSRGLNSVSNFGTTVIDVTGFKSHGYVSEHFNVQVSSVNSKDNGDFDINIKANGDEILGYIFDYDFDFTLSKFETEKLAKYYQSQNEDPQEIFKNLNKVKIDRLNGRVGEIVGFFTGIPQISKFNLKSHGDFSWDNENGLDSLNGTLVIDSDSNTSAERFFVKKAENLYEAVIKVENGRFFVNGNKFM